MRNGHSKKKIAIITVTLCLIATIGGLTAHASNFNSRSANTETARLGGFFDIFDIFGKWKNNSIDSTPDPNFGPSNNYWDTDKFLPGNQDDSCINNNDTNVTPTITLAPVVTQQPDSSTKAPEKTSTPSTPVTSKPSSDNSTPTVTDVPGQVGTVYSGPGKDGAGFHKPAVNASMDYNNSSSKYCFARSRESDHFYVFWDPGFGNNPNASSVPANLRVDVDDLLKKAEEYYYVNVNKLRMADGLLNGKKFQIYLIYQSEWLATGSGYDEKIGAIWVNPSTCQPVGSTIAHEIGHAFQYMVASKHAADGKGNIGQTGFRYGYPGSNGGNAFWEVSAQFQAYTIYPAESFAGHHMNVWFANYHRALEHESMRYQSYWWLYYVTEKHDINAFQRIWKESRHPEDALTTYMRLYLNNDLTKFYNNMYEFAAKATTFDFNTVRQYSDSNQGRYETALYPMGDGYSQVGYDRCPEANGFNAIKLDPNAGKKVTVAFKGLAPGSAVASSDPSGVRKYNSYSGSTGYRYGFVALLNDGKRVYSDSYADKQGNVSFDIPSGTRFVYFVVLGAPGKYETHAWDDNNANDVQMPYAVKISYQ